MAVSWGRVHKFKHTLVRISSDRSVKQLSNLFQADTSVESVDPETLEDAQTVDQNGTLLGHGLGRSYGDVALNEGGTLCLTSRFNHMIAADWKTGVIRAAAGLSFDELLKICVPKGWFLPVTPGTKFVTLGGAVANDVHGKNHHQAGSIGAHITRLQLHRSDKGVLECSPTQNADLFAMTIGGLGLTGFINWVEIQLKPVKSAYLDIENMHCANLDDFFKLSEESKDWPYTVMWVDCFARGKKLGRGIFSRGKPAPKGPDRSPVAERLAPHQNKSKPFPFSMPSWTLNRLTISIFNMLYRARPGATFVGRQHYDPFFYPLDGIAGWNKLYGKKGFFQHQCIIPPEHSKAGIEALLKEIGRSGQGSFLAVLKVHGPETSPGKMSFCMEGVSLALDFANRGKKTRALLDRLDAIVATHKGRLYPAKDGRMSAEHFQATYPNWRALEEARDPKISSSFWRRVTPQTLDVVQEQPVLSEDTMIETEPSRPLSPEEIPDPNASIEAPKTES